MSKHKTLYSHTHSFLSTTKHFRKIRRLDYIHTLYFLLYVNSVRAKQNLNAVKKCPFFSYSYLLLQKVLKFRSSSLSLVFLIKIVYIDKTFGSERFISIKGDFSDEEKFKIFGCWIGLSPICRVSLKGSGEGWNSLDLVGATLFWYFW